MIVDTNQLKNAKVGPLYIVGRAAHSSNLLKSGESVLLFAGLRTAIDWINKNYPDPDRDKESSHDGKDGSFWFFDSYEEAMKMFQETPEKIVKYDPTELRPTDFLEKGNELEYDVQGDFIDMGRFVEGEPESMGALHDGLARNRRVKMVIGLAQTSWMTQKDINHRSERIIRLVDALENAHVRSEINAVDSTECVHTEILVKRFDEGMTIEDIAVVTHSDFFRRIMFRCAEHSMTWRMGYGNAHVLRSNVSTLKSQLNDEISVYIDGDIAEKGNIDNLFNTLEKTLEKELSGMQPELNLISLTNNGIRVSRLDDV